MSRFKVAEIGEFYDTRRRFIKEVKHVNTLEELAEIHGRAISEVFLFHPEIDRLQYLTEGVEYEVWRIGE